MVGAAAAAAASKEGGRKGGVGLIGFGSGGRGALIGDYSEGRLERSEEKSRFLHHLCAYSPDLPGIHYSSCDKLLSSVDTN